jgi:hypothetical protein
MPGTSVRSKPGRCDQLRILVDPKPRSAVDQLLALAANGASGVGDAGIEPVTPAV